EEQSIGGLPGVRCATPGFVIPPLRGEDKGDLPMSARAGRPLVSVVIPNKDSLPLLRACIDGLRRSTYRPLEILVVENNSREPDTFAYYEELATLPDCRVLKWDGPFNFAAINNEAARRARGEVLLLLNNDVEPTPPDWIERMLELALQPGVGAV